MATVGTINSATMTANLAASYAPTSSSYLASYSGSLNFFRSKTYTNGTSADQANVLYDRTVSAAIGGTTIDLVPFTDAFGQSVTLPGVIKELIFYSSLATAAIVTITGNLFLSLAGNNAYALKLYGGGMIHFSNPQTGYTLTGGSADTLTFTSATGSVDVQVVMLGTHS